MINIVVDEEFGIVGTDRLHTWYVFLYAVPLFLIVGCLYPAVKFNARYSSKYIYGTVCVLVGSEYIA